MSKNATVKNPMKVITGENTRWSYANVWEPKSINGGTPKYSVSLIIPKSDTKTIAAINAAVDAAIEEGMFLTKFADKVIVSVMHDEGIMDCNEIAKGQALANPKMEFIWNTLPDEFVGTEDHLNGVVLKNTRTGDLQTVPVDSCFLFIG